MDPATGVKLFLIFLLIVSCVIIGLNLLGSNQVPTALATTTTTTAPMTTTPASMTTTPAPQVVTVYTGGNFTGSAINLKPGSYPASVFQPLVPNDTVSSVKVPAGLKLRLLFTSNNDSQSAVFTSDSASIPNNGSPNASAAIVELV